MKMKFIFDENLVISPYQTPHLHNQYKLSMNETKRTYFP